MGPSLLVTEHPEKGLQGFCDVLNKTRPEYLAVREKIVQLIQNWRKSGRRKSGPNVSKMKWPSGCPTLLEMGLNQRALISATNGPTVQLMVYYQPTPPRPWTEWDLACQQFLRLLMNPECERFGGPCLRCGKYFFRAGVKPKKFCSRECSSRHCAERAIKNKRAEEHEDKIERARQAIAEWERKAKLCKPRTTCWEFVCTMWPDITPRFLTRATHAVPQELHLPIEGGAHAKG
jgi:hypothetical protein